MGDAVIKILDSEDNGRFGTNVSTFHNNNNNNNNSFLYQLAFWKLKWEIYISSLILHTAVRTLYTDSRSEH